MFESINDLPAHIFFVHAPVVLVPLIALAAVVIAIRPQWRVRYAPLMAIASVGAFVATLLARKSGEEFDELLAGQVNVDRHETLADQTALIVFVLVLLTTTAAFISRRSPQARADGSPVPSTATTAMSVATVAVAALATWWMVRTGDEGAKLVWDGVVPQ